MKLKKILVKVLVLFLIFAGGVAGIAILMNSQNTDDRTDLNPGTLPEVMVNVDGIMVNRMYGYKQKMQVDFTRDSLTPLDTGKTLEFVINPYSAQVLSMAYEIRTSDGSKVVENKKISNLTEINGYLKASAKIESSMLMNQEYSLQISVNTQEETYYYYTRVIQRSNTNAGVYVAFARDFYEKCLDKSSAESLVNYLESDSSNTEENYSRVSITSPWSVVSWGDLSPEISRAAIPTIEDINETTGSVSVEYQITAQNEQGQTEIYEVTDFYRMRYADGNISLLNFERSAQQIFDGKEPVITTEGILLGIRDKNVAYMMDDQGEMVAFVQQGDLWSYSPESAKLIRIFTFRQDKNSDFRDSRNEHDIKIVRVEEDGDVDFVLYGYMNRGVHEGYTGVSVCHYNCDQNVVEERVFIPSTESYEFLKENLGTLSYVNEDHALFLLLGGKLYQINIQEQTYQILEEGISHEEFCVSDTNAHAAWTVSGSDGKEQIRMISFDTGETKDLAPAAGQKVKPLGFFNEDLVYGIAQEENLLSDIRGNEIYAMSTVQIQDFEGNVKKAYQPEGMLITQVDIGSTMMELQLSQRSGDSYTAVKTDHIMNNKKASAGQMDIELTYETRRGTLVRLAFDGELDDEEPLVVNAKLSFMNSKEVSLDTSVPEEEVYYVYARGHLDGIYTDPAQAVIAADEKMGVVLNRAQQYVWERGNRKTQMQMNLEDVPQSFLEGILDIGQLQESLGDTGNVLDLTGCTLDMILYQVSAQRPVVVKTGTNRVRVLYGYDSYNVWLYNPENGQTKAYEIEDMETLFTKYGNVYVTYIENLKE